MFRDGLRAYRSLRWSAPALVALVLANAGCAQRRQGLGMGQGMGIGQGLGVGAGQGIVGRMTARRPEPGLRVRTPFSDVQLAGRGQKSDPVGSIDMGESVVIGSPMTVGDPLAGTIPQATNPADATPRTATNAPAPDRSLRVGPPLY